MAINFKPSQAGLDKHLEGEHLEEAGLEHLPHLQEQLLDLRLRQQGDPSKLKTNEWRVTVRSRYPACHQEFWIMLYINFQPWTRLQRLSSILPAVCSVSGPAFRKLPSSIPSLLRKAVKLRGLTHDHFPVSSSSSTLLPGQLGSRRSSSNSR